MLCGAWFTSRERRGKSCWTRGNKLPQGSFKTECTHLPEFLVHRANQWASMDVCDRKRGGCGAIMNYVHSAASIAHKEAKARMKGKKKEVTTISQRAAQIVEGTHTKEQEDVVYPRCDRELYVFNTTSGPILRCRGWTLAGTPCTLIKACQNGVIIPGGLQNTNRTEGGKLSEWFWWLRNTSKTRRWHPKSTSFKRLDSPGSSVGGKSSLGAGTVCSVATSPSTVSAAPSISTTVRGDVDDRSLASASRRRRIHWGPVEYGHRNGSDWCVTAQSSVETEPESVNRQQNKDSKDRFNCKKKNEPVLTASQF